jgi:hypothetical protein
MWKCLLSNWNLLHGTKVIEKEFGMLQENNIYKNQLLRSRLLDPNSLGVVDCHYNMAVLYLLSCFDPSPLETYWF